MGWDDSFSSSFFIITGNGSVTVEPEFASAFNCEAGITDFEIFGFVFQV